ncbi:MAG: hypothetical protein J6U43_00385, partial [Bacteroidales bacterium]|nr:hypothetical protein [Bacteroidales bacterium]
NWRLTVQGDNLYAVQYIEVAEYKRPQFAIECRAIERIYSYGDSVCVEGSAHTYAGVEVAFAQVDYTVRQYAYIYGGGSVVARGTTTTDSEGDFAVSFVAVKPQEEYARWWGTRYVVDIIVTSPTGESRQAEAVVSVAGVGVKFNCDIPNKVCREEAMPFALRIVNGSSVVQQLPYELSLYRMYDKGVATEPIREDVAVWQAHGIGADDKLMLPYKIMSSQAYRLVMTTHTPAGVLVADSVDFLCY